MLTSLLTSRTRIGLAACAVLAATAVPAHRAAAQTIVDGGQTLNISSDTTYGSGLYVGNTSTGTVNQSAGTVAVSSAFSLGNGTGAVGYYNMSGGTLNANASGEQLNVGSNGTGTFVQTGNSTVNTYTLNLQTGTNSSYSMATGGTLNVSSLFSVKVGNTYTQTGGTTTIGTGTTGGTFRVYGGSTMNLSGGTFTATSTSTGIGSGNLLGYFAGANATGTLNLSGTGAIAFTGTAFNVGLGATGVINQSGTSTLTAAKGIILGTNYTSGSFPYTGSGTANLDGGTLSTTAITLGAVATSGTTISTAPGTGVVNLNGGTLTALASTTNFLSVTTANVRNGGAVIDTGANAVTISQALLHSNISGDNATDGGLTKLGTGTLTLTGTNTYTGGTTVNAGTLSLGATAADGTGTLTVNSGGTTTITANNALGGGNVTLAGGTLQNAVTAPGTLPTTNQQTSGILSLTTGTASTLDFGAGNAGAVFTFTGFDAANTGTLSILNYLGTPGVGNGLDQLFVAGTPLTPTQLGQINFLTGGQTFGASQLASGEIVKNTPAAAPEPSQFAAFAVGLLSLGALAMKAKKRQVAL